MLTCCRSMGSELVRIFVDPPRKLFAVHKDLICSASKLFQDNLGPVGNEIALAATDPEIFEVFVAWLYQQELDRRFHDEVGWAVNDLIDIYFFGDHIQCNGLKNITMDELQNSHQAGIDQDLDFDHMRRSFGNEEWESKEPIRKFAIAALYWHVWAQKFYSAQETFDLLEDDPTAFTEFLQYQIQMYHSEHRGSTPFWREDVHHFNMCYFHLHAEGEVCTSIESSLP